MSHILGQLEKMTKMNFGVLAPGSGLLCSVAVEDFCECGGVLYGEVNLT